MKSTAVIVLYFVSFGAFYLLMSVFGLVFRPSYVSVITDQSWFCFYGLFFGWWLAFLPAHELLVYFDEQELKQRAS